MLAKHILPIGGRVGFGGRRLAGLGVVGAKSVKFFRLLECRIVAFAFFREHVQHHGMLTPFGVLQRLYHQRQIMAVKRADVPDAQFLKNNTARRAAAAILKHGRLMRKRTAGHLGLERAFRAIAQAYGKIAFRQFFYQPR